MRLVSAARRYRYEAGKQVYDDRYRLVALGANNSGLAHSGSSESRRVILADDSLAQSGDLDGYVATRQHGTGFHVAIEANTGLVLFNIDAGGSSTALGTYPAAATQFLHSSTVLGSDDAL